MIEALTSSHGDRQRYRERIAARYCRRGVELGDVEDDGLIWCERVASPERTDQNRKESK